MNDGRDRRILVVVAFERFRDEEYLVPREIFEAAGCAVTTCSTQLGKATGKLGAAIQIDITLGNASAAVHDAVVFVGGPGSKTLWDNVDAHQLARAFRDTGKLVCAICSAPIILARAGLLEGRSATCFEGDRLELERVGAVYTGGEVTLDGRFITGNGPAAADAFAHAIIGRLGAGTAE